MKDDTEHVEGADQEESDNFISNTDNVVQTAHLILKAMKERGIQANEVLLYQDLYPYLQEHSKHEHYRDVQKDAEHHLAKESLVTPDASGLRLTQVGYKVLQEKRL
jgi:glutamate synthase domain-containing protein 1